MLLTLHLNLQAAAGTHALTATGITTGAPTVGTPTLAIVGAQPAQTGGAVLAGGRRRRGTSGRFVRVGDDGRQLPAYAVTVEMASPPALAAGAPKLGRPRLSRQGELVTGAPALGTPKLERYSSLKAKAVRTAIPKIGTPDLGQTHAFQANAMTGAAPVSTWPALRHMTWPEVLQEKVRLEAQLKRLKSDNEVLSVLLLAA